mmetsp:Transcript_21528/g.58857  ORF Transcript_21528/g.58857 Transcript_21528/m.58857 type:complete len:311 (+) Transcript_21528:204-1136(+)
MGLVRLARALGGVARQVVSHVADRADLRTHRDHLLLRAQREAAHKGWSAPEPDVDARRGPVVDVEQLEERGTNHQGEILARARPVHPAAHNAAVNRQLRKAERLPVLLEGPNHKLVGVRAPLLGVGLRVRNVRHHALAALVLVHRGEPRALVDIAQRASPGPPTPCVERARLCCRAASASGARRPMREGGDRGEEPNDLPAEACRLLAREGGLHGIAAVVGEDEAEARADGRGHGEAAERIECIEERARGLNHTTGGRRAVLLLERLPPARLDDLCVLLDVGRDLVADGHHGLVGRGVQELGGSIQRDHL